MKLKKMANKNLVITFFAVLLIGTFVSCLLILVFKKRFISQFVWPSAGSIWDYYPEELADDQYYKIELYNIFDCYAEDDEGYYYITNTYGSDGLKYMGIYAYLDQSEAFDELCDSTWNYIENEVDDGKVLKGRCVMYDMGDTEKDLFLEYFEGSDIDRSDMVFKTLVFLPTWDTVWDEINWAVYIGLGLVLLILFLEIREFIEYSKQGKRCLEEYGLRLDYLDQDIQFGHKYGSTVPGNVVFGNNNLLYITTVLALALPYDRIVGAVITTRSSSSNVANYVLLLQDDLNNIYTIRTDNRFECERIQDEIIKRAINIDPQKCN